VVGLDRVASQLPNHAHTCACGLDSLFVFGTARYGLSNGDVRDIQHELDVKTQLLVAGCPIDLANAVEPETAADGLSILCLRVEEDKSYIG